jgi:hypothetical protein
MYKSRGRICALNYGVTETIVNKKPFCKMKLAWFLKKSCLGGQIMGFAQ